MSNWIEVVKGSRVDYTGTCPKCGEFIRQSSVNKGCPMKLPAKSSTVPRVSACPMKVERA